MKIYKLPQLADSSPSSVYRIGPENSSASSVYMVYGRIRPNEAARKVECAAGHEEIFCVVKGALSVKKGRSSFQVGAGEAFHALPGTVLYLESAGGEEAVYLAAGSVGAAAAKHASSGRHPAAAEPEVKQEPPDDGVSLDSEDEFEITTDDEEPGPGEDKGN